MLSYSLMIFIALGTTMFAQSYEEKVDKAIKAGAVMHSAARVGDIRGTIAYDQKVIIVTPDALREPENTGNIDKTRTNTVPGNTRSRDPVVRWEVFDSEGRLLEIVE